MTTKTEPGTKHLTIKAPNLETASFTIIGTSPYVQNKMSERAKEAMHEKQEAGSVAKKGQKRDPKDFEAACWEASHKSDDGWYGIPCTSFRAALISACRMCGFKMTLAKLSIIVEPDGIEREKYGFYQLVKITKGKPVYTEYAVKNASGVADLRPRPMWEPGWEATVRITYDADQFTSADVANLLLRAGLQVGIGAGRMDSSDSAGCGWGSFKLAEKK